MHLLLNHLEQSRGLLLRALVENRNTSSDVFIVSNAGNDAVCLIHVGCYHATYNTLYSCDEMPPLCFRRKQEEDTLSYARLFLRFIVSVMLTNFNTLSTVH